MFEGIKSCLSITGEKIIFSNGVHRGLRQGENLSPILIFFTFERFRALFDKQRSTLLRSW